MKITNRFGLPEPLVKLAEADNYSRGAARISVTGLIEPPQIARLREKHRDQIESDVSDNIWRMLGTAVHSLLEQSGDETHLPEERLFADIDGWTISGAIDLQIIQGNRVRIRDYKVTAVYSVLADKPEWIAQANCYAYLCREAKGYEVDSIGVVAMLRDWLRARAKTDLNYPQSNVINVAIPMWSHQQAKEYLQSRVALHREALRCADWSEPLPACTDEERWARSEGWAIKKKGGKRAIKIYDTEAEAVAALKVGQEISHRPPEFVRCAGNYCHVAQWCPQHNASQRSEPTDEVGERMA